MKTKMLHADAIKPSARQWLELYQQYVEEGNPLTVTVEGPNGYEFLEVGVDDLDRVQAILPEDDSTGPENAPQKRNDALALYNQTRGNEVIDPRKAVRQLLKSFDTPDAEDWILPEQTVMNPQVAATVGELLRQTLVEANMPEEQAENLVLMVMQRAMDQTGLSEPPTSENGATPSVPSTPEGA